MRKPGTAWLARGRRLMDINAEDRTRHVCPNIASVSFTRRWNGRGCIFNVVRVRGGGGLWGWGWGWVGWGWGVDCPGVVLAGPVLWGREREVEEGGGERERLRDGERARERQREKDGGREWEREGWRERWRGKVADTRPVCLTCVHNCTPL